MKNKKIKPQQTNSAVFLGTAEFVYSDDYFDFSL